MTDRNRRKNLGAFYTPEPLVRYLVERTLGPLIRQTSAQKARTLRILDPACGDGAFLVAAARYLREQLASQPIPTGQGVEQSFARASAAAHLYGVDIDVAAVRAARRRLDPLAVTAQPKQRAGQVRKASRSIASTVASTIKLGDALIDPVGQFHSRGLDWTSAFPEVFADAVPGFDAIIANPPYINIRLLTKTHGNAVKDYFRSKYRCARRGFDLYVLFLERAYQLLKPGGLCGMVVPNKLAAMQYAGPCRQLLLQQTTLWEIVDVTDLRAFPGAGVYPYLVLWEKRAATNNHCIRVARVTSLSGLDTEVARRRVPQSRLNADDGFPLDDTLDVESRVPTRSLGECVRLHSGTTGFAAQEVAASLTERDQLDDRAGYRFIVSGNIDRYRILGGKVRYMKRVFEHPVLPHDCTCLSPAKHQLFRSEKIVVAGMTRRLEAAWDAGGLSLGVQVYAAAGARHPWYLLGLLNSKLFSYLFRSRFAAKRLAGDYLSINKSQLAALPVREVAASDPVAVRCRRRIAELARRMWSLCEQLADLPSSSATDDLQSRMRRTDAAIDRYVYQLYRLDECEIQRLEDALPAKAA
jgi:methylase of polypeptide subunit release factors